MEDSRIELLREYRTKWVENGPLAEIALRLVTRPVTAKTTPEHRWLDDTGPNQVIEAVHSNTHVTVSHIGSTAITRMAGSAAYAEEAFTASIAFSEGSRAVAMAPKSVAFAAHPGARVGTSRVGSIVGGVEGTVILVAVKDATPKKYVVGTDLEPNELYRVFLSGFLTKLSDQEL